MRGYHALGQIRTLFAAWDIYVTPAWGETWRCRAMLLGVKATKANHVFVPGVGGGKYVLPLDYVGIRPHNMVSKCAWIRSVGTHATVNLVK